MIRLEKSLVRIGSDPENDIVIRDDVVSRHHAEIRIAENGESWIRDLGSVNGTFVNGDKLGRQERMLMDSDEISIAFFDFLFLDAFSPDKNPELWTFEFIASLKRLLNPRGCLATYSSAYPFLGALHLNGFHIFESAPFGRKRGGTVASLSLLEHLPPLRGIGKPDSSHD